MRCNIGFCLLIRTQTVVSYSLQRPNHEISTHILSRLSHILVILVCVYLKVNLSQRTVLHMWNCSSIRQRFFICNKRQLLWHDLSSCGKPIQSTSIQSNSYKAIKYYLRFANVSQHMCTSHIGPTKAVLEKNNVLTLTRE